MGAAAHTGGGQCRCGTCLASNKANGSSSSTTSSSLLRSWGGCSGCRCTKGDPKTHSRNGEIERPIANAKTSDYNDDSLPGFSDDIVPFFADVSAPPACRVVEEIEMLKKAAQEQDAQLALKQNNRDSQGSSMGRQEIEIVRSCFTNWRSIRNPDISATTGGRATQPISWRAVTKALQEMYVTYEDKSQYMGQFMGEKRHGHGVWKSMLGQYDGEWKFDMHDGDGKLIWFQDGRRYEGQFKEGKFHGRGRFQWRTQKGILSYEGQYADDFKHGNGRLEWPDGRVYDGGWEDGKRDGEGTFSKPDGWSRQGIWENDKLIRWTSMPPVTLRPAPPARSATSFLSDGS